MIFFILGLVTWMLFIILKNYSWGIFFFNKGIFLKLYFFFNNFFVGSLSIFRLFFDFYFYLFFYSFYFSQVVIYYFSFWFFFYLPFFVFPSGALTNYFSSEVKNSLNFRYFFLILGFSFISKGNFLVLKENLQTPFSMHHYVKGYFSNINHLQILEKFLYGKFLPVGFSLIKEKPYFVQKFIHNNVLEILWATFPTIICIIIIIPSLILLYSSAAIRVFDFTQNITGNQWFWNYNSKKIVPINIIPSYIALDLYELDMLINGKSIENPILQALHRFPSSSRNAFNSFLHLYLISHPQFVDTFNYTEALCFLDPSFYTWESVSDFHLPAMEFLIEDFMATDVYLSWILSDESFKDFIDNSNFFSMLFFDNSSLFGLWVPIEDFMDTDAYLSWILSDESFESFIYNSKFFPMLFSDDFFLSDKDINFLYTHNDLFSKNSDRLDYIYFKFIANTLIEKTIFLELFFSDDDYFLFLLDWPSEHMAAFLDTIVMKKFLTAFLSIDNFFFLDKNILLKYLSLRDITGSIYIDLYKWMHIIEECFIITRYDNLQYLDSFFVQELFLYRLFNLGDFTFVESDFFFNDKIVDSFFLSHQLFFYLIEYTIALDLFEPAFVRDFLATRGPIITSFTSKAIFDVWVNNYGWYDRYELASINTPHSFLKFYSDDGPLNDDFDSFLLSETDLSDGQKRLSDTDLHLILPTLFSVRLLVNAVDVLHAFVMLSTGVKIDAVVGRLNEVTVYLLRSGIFYGACSELCGSGHFGMPIVIESLQSDSFDSFNEYKLWNGFSNDFLTPFVSNFDNFSGDFSDFIAGEIFFESLKQQTAFI
jgi:heme/copper-type cytochrome/quinol oxidase subunit 2